MCVWVVCVVVGCGLGVSGWYICGSCVELGCVSIWMRMSVWMSE